MELDNRPASAEFTAARDVRIVSELGNMCSNFAAGETRRIPKALFNAALVAGLIPEGPLEVAVAVKKPPQAETVRNGLMDACKTLITRGVAEDFTVAGHPRTASIQKLVDFSFTAADMRVAFEEAMHEVNGDGNNSTEHSEPSSVAAE